MHIHYIYIHSVVRWGYQPTITNLSLLACPQIPYGSRMGIDGEGTWGFSISHDGSMVLLYMVCHGSHQYTPNVTIYSSTMDPSWDLFLNGDPLLLGKECLWT